MNTQILKRILADQMESVLGDQEKMLSRDVKLFDSLEDKEITIVTGVRRCGKSSLIKELIKSLQSPQVVLYLNLDDPRLLHFKADDFELLYDIWLESHETGQPKIAIFDEVQNIPGWERWMTFFSEQKKFKVIVTGSNSKLLSRELGTHLTGRHKDIELFPLSYGELLKNERKDIYQKVGNSKAISSVEYAELSKLFIRYCKLGGFPRAWISHSTALLGEYYSDILNRDIVGRHRLQQPQLISGFGSALMSDLGRRINKSKLARVVGIKEVNTINKYFGYFSECYLGFELRKFETSVRRQMRSLSKFYAIDPVLAQQVGISSESKDGFYLENLVLIELLRRGNQVFYWQADNSSEIDFVVETPSRELCLLQVAWELDGESTLRRELKGFADFQEAFPKIRVSNKTIITVEQCRGIEFPKGVECHPFVLWAIDAEPK